MSLLYASAKLTAVEIKNFLEAGGIEESIEYLAEYEKLCRQMIFLLDLMDEKDSEEMMKLLQTKMSVLLKKQPEKSGGSTNQGTVRYFDEVDFEACKFLPDPQAYDFKNVAGNKKAVESLTEIAAGIQETRQNGLNDDQTFRYLMYGPAGTGKTFMAKCLSTLLDKHGIETYILDASDLKGSYKGQTEKNISNLFDIIERRKPGYVMILIDEIETMFSDSSSGAESIFKARMQERPATGVVPIFVAATNYIDKIPGAIKSRMEPIFVDILKNQDLADKLEKDFMGKFVLSDGNLFGRQDLDRETSRKVFFACLSNLLAGFSGRDINTLIRKIKGAQMRKIRSARELNVVSANDINNGSYFGNIAQPIDNMDATSYFFNKESETPETFETYYMLTSEEIKFYNIQSETIEFKGSWPECKGLIQKKPAPSRMFPLTLMYDDIIYYAGVMNGPTVEGQEYFGSKVAGDENVYASPPPTIDEFFGGDSDEESDETMGGLYD